MGDEMRCKHNYLMRLKETPLHGPGEYYCKGTPIEPGCGAQFKLAASGSDRREFRQAGAGVSEKMDYRDTVLALLDKVRQAQAAECAKHVPLVGSLGEVIGCHECDWRSVGENGVDEWREHLTALGRK